MAVMRKSMPLAAVLALGGLSACGGSDPAPAPSETAVSEIPLTESAGAITDGPAAEATTGAVVAPTAAPATSASASASAAPTRAAATPSPSPSAMARKTPAAAATPVAAAERPPAFGQCAVCHAVQPGKHGVGPSLAGVYGKKAGEMAGYSFSPALKASGLVWNDANLDKWLAAPMSMVPGTKMAYPGVKDAGQRRALIAYLKALK